MRILFNCCGVLIAELLLATTAFAATVSLDLVSGIPFNSGDGGNGPTEIIDSTSDGRFLLLRTGATNLVKGIDDRNGTEDLLVYDLSSGQLDWITLDPDLPGRSRQN